MSSIFQKLRPFIRWIVRHNMVVLGIALLVSAVSMYFVVQLRIDTDLSNLVPDHYPSVQALEKLRETVGGESDVGVVIESPSFEANKTFAEALIPRALELEDPKTGEPYLTRVEYTRDTEFLENNALYFATPDELDSLYSYLTNKIEEAKLEANPFFFDIEDEEDMEEEEDTVGASMMALYEQIVGKEYPISDDSTMMLLRFFPSGAQTDIGFIERLYSALEALIEEMNPASVHPEMETTLSGRLLRQAVEVRAITDDVFSSFGAGVATVLMTVVFYFLYKGYRARSGGRYSKRALLVELKHLPIMAILIGLPLLMSLTWTFAFAYLSFEVLNLMTSTLGLVLFGLGIDFGIHTYARYTEERAKGHSIEQAAEITFLSTGQGVTVGAMTTAAALYVLTFADFRGFSEFGLVAGTGIIFALIAMMLVLPALITFFEKIKFLELERVGEGMAAHTNTKRFPAVRPILLGSIAAVILAIVMISRVEFEYQFGKLEPEYVEYSRRLAKERQVVDNGGRRNPAYVVVDDPDEVMPIVAALKQHAAADTLTPTIGSIESLQDRFPLTEEAKLDKLARIASIRELLDEPLLQAEESVELERVRRAASTTRPIELSEVPEFLRKQFTSKTGEMGNFIMIYPSVGLSDGRKSMEFADDVGRIVTADGKVYHAGSTSLVAADMFRLLMKDTPWMVLGVFAVVALVMYLNFRSIKWSAVALIPLVVGVLWMILLMEVFGMKLNMYNLIVLPAVLGIGNDAGVHLVHRYLEEGKGSIRRMLNSTGEHVFMSSLTTMIGFGGLLLSFHPGLRSIGELAVAGIGMTLVAALVFLPALLQWMEDREKPEAPASGTDGRALTGQKVVTEAP